MESPTEAVDELVKFIIFKPKFHEIVYELRTLRFKSDWTKVKNFYSLFEQLPVLGLL